MSISVNAASAATAALGKSHHAPKAGHDLNPAQQARAADPSAKGAAFGALVSSIARAKHAPPPPTVTAPATTPPATTTEPPAATTTEPPAATTTEPPAATTTEPPVDIVV
jgi:hypothetical protein